MVSETLPYMPDWYNPPPKNGSGLGRQLTTHQRWLVAWIVRDAVLIYAAACWWALQ